MSLRVLIVADKFKGTLTAQAVAAAIAKGWRQSRRDDVLDLLPMSDGGDGFGEVLSLLLGAARQKTRTVDAAHRPCQAAWWWDATSKTAILESATATGLALLPPKKFHPFDLDTFGLGAVVQAAAAKGARRCVMGVGGSATNDGGFGLARALGWEFLDRDGQPVTHWTGLRTLHKLLAPERRRWFEELVVAVDVQNPLLGPQGATRVFGPQKGLRPKDFPVAENCLRRLATVVEQQLNRPFVSEAGTGAAGGLGFGLRSFLGGRLEPGFALFARMAELRRRMSGAQLILTAEGTLDASTLMGKGVGEIGWWSRKLNVPCLAFAGAIRQPKLVARHFTQAHSLTPRFVPLKKAMAQPERCLSALAAQVAAHWPA